MRTIIGRSRQGYPTLQVYVQPRASRNKCCGLDERGLKLKITAPPVDDRANAAVRDYLAELFGVRSASIGLVSGRQSREKVFYFNTLSEQSLADRLAALL